MERLQNGDLKAAGRHDILAIPRSIQVLKARQLSVSSDEQWFLSAVVTPSLGSDIMQVEDFR